jgi:hypothetical protein
MNIQILAQIMLKMAEDVPSHERNVIKSLKDLLEAALALNIAHRHFMSPLGSILDDLLTEDLSKCSPARTIVILELLGVFNFVNLVPAKRTPSVKVLIDVVFPLYEATEPLLSTRLANEVTAWELDRVFCWPWFAFYWV